MISGGGETGTKAWGDRSWDQNTVVKTALPRVGTSILPTPYPLTLKSLALTQHDIAAFVPRTLVLPGPPSFFATRTVGVSPSFLES
jgi:hypothetical protein